MTITSQDLDAMLPTDDEVAEYRERGWYVSRKILSDALLDSVIEASERYMHGEMEDGPPITEFSKPSNPPRPGLRKHDYSSLRCAGIMQLVRAPIIAAVAARLAGTTGLRLWHDQLLYKPPQEPGVMNKVGWHTDRSYWRACSSDDMLTAWVPFHTITIDHGPLTMIEGSNRWRREEMGKPDFFRQDLETQEDEIQRDTGRKITKVPILLERGQVSFHHCRTYHGSGPNLSSEPRRSLAIHLQPEDNRASGELSPEGPRITHASDTLCRWVDDLPDYTDPAYFPVLYPEPLPT